ncbi:hypothetical protein [Pedobacter gandavensis]|uniref:hypothetical protein n=1 Tax=Pedobacter gandavensis TaxID=2679963 RepID=UPI00292E3508|nr:hypothetical protein [Pedobacter gandavensis]
MKTKSFTQTLCLIFFMVLLLSSCSKKFVMQNSGIAPAAYAIAKVDKGDNDNYKVEIKVTHLAPSKDLHPSRKTYVVWMETDKNGTKNIGQLQSSSSMFSRLLKGYLETFTSFKPVGFFITAENEPAISYPGSMVIFKSN